MDELFVDILTAFDIRLMFSISILTYIVLKAMSTLKCKNNKLIKHSITIVITIALSAFYHYEFKVPLEKIIPTYLLTTAFYNSIISYIIARFNIGYKSTK